MNGRISDKSLERYMKLKRILKNVLGKIDHFYMQTPLDGERIETIGSDSSKVSVAGNLKFDIELQNYSEEEKNELKEIIKAEGRKIFVAGSTRTGEDKVSVAGNLKFDIELQNYSEEEKNELKEIIKAEGRKIFVAGSTRTGEDEVILDAFGHLKDYMLILVPRHLDRIETCSKAP